jgi:hypothetical protein
LEHEGKHTGGCHSADKSHYAEKDGAEVVRGEEFVVEEENGDLYHTEIEGIDDLNYPAYLKYRLVLSWKRAERRDTR